jgi:hypothetical protein
MSNTMYVSEFRVDIREKSSNDPHGEFGNKALPGGNIHVCTFDDESDSTESLLVKRLNRKTSAYASINCLFRRSVIPPTPVKPLAIVRGNSKSILGWYSSLEKDDEFANIVDETIDRMRELKLR